jgi:hypothetical protein
VARKRDKEKKGETVIEKARKREIAKNGETGIQKARSKMPRVVGQGSELLLANPPRSPFFDRSQSCQ